MKTHHDISHEGTMGDEDRTRMTFDENSIAHLMSVLTDLYSDPALAVIREYSTNALDSNRATGNPNPIEVELPTSLRPLFVVRDRGLGLSLDEIQNNFSKYGWSSKRESDEAVGMLGLGCKSALSYTSQFTMVAIKGGLKVTVLITRDTDGCGALQIMDTCATDEPNGVEIQIPVKLNGDFSTKARDFFFFWEENSVLIDGVDPASTKDTAWTSDGSERIDPDIALHPHWQGAATFYIVMGNVPYPVAGNMIPDSIRYLQQTAIVRVPIGAVNFTPSREQLHFTNRTKDVLHLAGAFIHEASLRHAQAEIDAQPTSWDALKTSWKWKALFGGNRSDGLKWRWAVLPKGQYLALPKDTYKWFPGTMRNGKAQSADKVNNVTYRDIDPRYSRRTPVFVRGHKANGLRAELKDRMVAWAVEQEIKQPTFYVIPDSWDDVIYRAHGKPTGTLSLDWFDGIPTVHIDELPRNKAASRPRKAASDRTFQVFHIGAQRGTSMLLEDFKDSPTYYVEAGPSGGDTHWNAPLRVLNFYNNAERCYVVRLKSNEVNSFLKLRPGTENLSVALDRALRSIFEESGDWVHAILSDNTGQLTEFPSDWITENKPADKRLRRIAQSHSEAHKKLGSSGISDHVMTEATRFLSASTNWIFATRNSYPYPLRNGDFAFRQSVKEDMRYVRQNFEYLLNASDMIRRSESNARTFALLLHAGDARPTTRTRERLRNRRK